MHCIECAYSNQYETPIKIALYNAPAKIHLIFKVNHFRNFLINLRNIFKELRNFLLKVSVDNFISLIEFNLKNLNSNE